MDYPLHNGSSNIYLTQKKIAYLLEKKYFDSFDNRVINIEPIC